MKLWKVSRTDRIGYDDYDSMVVAAETELEARTYHPGGYVRAKFDGGFWYWVWDGGNLDGKRYNDSCWGRVEDLRVEYLGTTDRDIRGVILASFNAG